MIKRRDFMIKRSENRIIYLLEQNSQDEISPFALFKDFFSICLEWQTHSAYFSFPLKYYE